MKYKPSIRDCAIFVCFLALAWVLKTELFPPLCSGEWEDYRVIQQPGGFFDSERGEFLAAYSQIATRQFPEALKLYFGYAKVPFPIVNACQQDYGVRLFIGKKYIDVATRKRRNDNFREKQENERAHEEWEKLQKELWEVPDFLKINMNSLTMGYQLMPEELRHRLFNPLYFAWEPLMDTVKFGEEAENMLCFYPAITRIFSNDFVEKFVFPKYMREKALFDTDEYERITDAFDRVLGNLEDKRVQEWFLEFFSDHEKISALRKHDEARKYFNPLNMEWLNLRFGKKQLPEELKKAVEVFSMNEEKKEEVLGRHERFFDPHGPVGNPRSMQQEYWELSSMEKFAAKIWWRAFNRGEEKLSEQKRKESADKLWQEWGLLHNAWIADEACQP